MSHVLCTIPASRLTLPAAGVAGCAAGVVCVAADALATYTLLSVYRCERMTCPNHIQAAAMAVQEGVRVIPTAIALANFSQHGLTVAQARDILVGTPVLSAALERCASDLACL